MSRLTTGTPADQTTAALRTIADHCAQHRLDLVSVNIGPTDWHAQLYDCGITGFLRAAHSIGATTATTSLDNLGCYHLTATGHIGDHTTVFALVLTDPGPEHAALHGMAITGDLTLNQLAHFIRDEDAPPRKHVLSADCWCNPDVTIHSVRHHGDTTTGWLTVWLDGATR